MTSSFFSKQHLLLPMLAIIALTLGGFQSLLAAMTPVKLQCEDRVNPVGMDVINPQLSWILTSDQRGEKQTACQILAASSLDKLKTDTGDLWDSGNVISNASAQIAYAGKPLTTHLAGQLSAARNQPVRLLERFVHPFARRQDYPDQRLHTSGVGQRQSEYETGLSDNLRFLMFNEN
jgi:hypothetical protein